MAPIQTVQFKVSNKKKIPKKFKSLSQKRQKMPKTEVSFIEQLKINAKIAKELAVVDWIDSVD